MMFPSSREMALCLFNECSVYSQRYDFVHWRTVFDPPFRSEKRTKGWLGFGLEVSRHGLQSSATGRRRHREVGPFIFGVKGHRFQGGAHGAGCMALPPLLPRLTQMEAQAVRATSMQRRSMSPS